MERWTTILENLSPCFRILRFGAPKMRAVKKDRKPLFADVNGSMGLASGGRLDNCILIDHEKVVNTKLRFLAKFPRHQRAGQWFDAPFLGDS